MADYSVDEIQVLSGLEPVQKRPGMYTRTDDPTHLAQEVIDNSIDEAIAGFASQICVTQHTDGSLSVLDNGRGMPFAIHPTHNISGIELILTKLHSGAKFSNKSYSFSGGLHGVGVSVVNALSQKLEVIVQRDGKRVRMEFANGTVSKPLETLSASLPKKQTGTLVRFWPNAKYFDSATFNQKRLLELLRAKAVLCPGLHIYFLDESTDKKTEWLYQGGILEYLLEHLAPHDLLPAQGFHSTYHHATGRVEVSFAWTTAENISTFTESYVNLIPTAEGGTHVSGLRSAVSEAIREFCEIHALLPKGIKLTAEDICDKLSFVLSIHLQNAQFLGQTKDKLTSREATSFVNNALKDAFSLWCNQHVQEAQTIAEFCIANAIERNRKNKSTARKKVYNGLTLPGKLADCQTQEIHRSEIFFVEGDSAGGSAKSARDKAFQAILPLRGKILNTWELNSHDITSSKEVLDIATALGISPGNSDLSTLRYGKVCILADADSDGQHICTLLIALFLKHFPALVQKGHIYVVEPPLYRIDIGKKIYYAQTEAEKTKILNDAMDRKNINIQRFKGLGEMNPSQLRETALNPATRKLTQLQVSSISEAEQILDKLLSKKRAPERKMWLESSGQFAEKPHGK